LQERIRPRHEILIFDYQDAGSIPEEATEFGVPAAKFVNIGFDGIPGIVSLAGKKTVHRVAERYKTCAVRKIQERERRGRKTLRGEKIAMRPFPEEQRPAVSHQAAKIFNLESEQLLPGFCDQIPRQVASVSRQKLIQHSSGREGGIRDVREIWMNLVQEQAIALGSQGLGKNCASRGCQMMKDDHAHWFRDAR